MRYDAASERIKELEATVEKLKNYTIVVKCGEMCVVISTPEGGRVLSTGETLTINPSIEVFKV
jgi:hypothetical protein